MLPRPAPRSCWSAIRKQLQAIEAGAAFRSIHERHGGAEIGEVRRQREDWQRDATRDLANRQNRQCAGSLSLPRHGA